MQPIKIPTLSEKEENLPSYGSKLAAGADVRANITENMQIDAGKTALVPTGLYFAIPEGYEIQVRPRSGLALKHSVTVLNSPGTIDADYRGELKVILINHGCQPFLITPGMRIAQIVLAAVCQAEFVKEEQLVASERGSGGFGSTGVN